MRHRFSIFTSASLLAVLLSSCLSTQVSLDYVPNVANMHPGPPVVSVGVFRDNRGEEPKLLGTVKTPIGTPFERIYLKLPTDEAVQNAFLHALAARGMMAPAASARYSLEGSIEEFYTNLLTKPYAYVRLNVDLVDLKSNRVVYHHTYEAERQAATFLPGYGDPVPMLRELASAVLQDAVDRAIDAPMVRQAMGEPSRSNSPVLPSKIRRNGY